MNNGETDGLVLLINRHNLSGHNYYLSGHMFLFEMGKDDNLMCPTAPPQKIQNSRFISTKQYGHVSDSWLINSMDNETRKYFLFYYLTHGILSAAKKKIL